MQRDAKSKLLPQINGRFKSIDPTLSKSNSEINHPMIAGTGDMRTLKHDDSF